MIHIIRKDILTHVLLIALTLILCACDPAIFYKPSGWTEASHLQWSKTVGPVELTFSTMGGFHGSRNTGLEGFITNHSDVSSVSIRSATLRTHKGNFAAVVDKRPLAPGETRKTVLYWDLKEPLIDVLIEPVELETILQIGEDETLFQIPMVRK